MKDVTVASTLSGRLGKDSDAVSGVGLLDEANAFTGLARVFAKKNKTKKILEEIQAKVFDTGVEFGGGKQFPSDNYDRIMELVSHLEKKVEKPTRLITLEQNEQTGFLSVARAVVRRCERQAVRLHKKGELSLIVVEWLNKLSYLLYLLILLEMGEDRDEIRELDQ